jgi:hypothetical protein
MMFCGIAAVGAVLFVFDPARYAWYPACPLHSFTGLSCPGCGTTRALHQLLHGHFLAALRLNALAVLALPVAAVVCVIDFLRSGSARRPLLASLNPAWMWISLGMIVAFGIVRNLPVPPFNQLTP